MVGLDDNKAPTDVFMWCNGMQRRPPDLQFNHIYRRSKDPDCYCCLANICVTPSFIAKLTDTRKEITDILKYRVWELYGWHPMHEQVPIAPKGYAELEWAPCLPAVHDVKDRFRSVLARRVKDRTSMFANEIGVFL